MIISITGTPATGKTEASRKLAELTGLELVSLNELAEKNGLYDGYDDERDCKIVDIKSMKSELERISGKNLIIESHYAHEFPADLAIVLRASPKEVRARGKDKGWDFSKSEENVMSEIMEICKSEALENGMVVREYDTTGKTPEQSAKALAHILEKEGLFVSGNLKLPDSMREELREPYGELFSDLDKAVAYMKGTEIISVGDEASQTLHSSGVTPDVIIVDGKIRRKPAGKGVDVRCQTLNTKNQVGYISNGLWMTVKKALDSEKPVMVNVEGEEDMAVIPAVLLAKDGMSVIYGLFDKGVCVAKVDGEMKRKARNALRKISASQ